MAVDSKIEESINIAVKEARCLDSTSKILISWIDSLIEGNENLNNNEDVIRRFDTLFNTIQVDE